MNEMQNCMEESMEWEKYTHSLDVIDSMIREQKYLLKKGSLLQGSHNDLDCLNRTRELLVKKYERFEADHNAKPRRN